VPDITAVRSDDAKLIEYVGHPEWSELFDLKSDPYETSNLFRDAAHEALRQKMEAEHLRLAKEVGYRVPDYTDRPEWWGKPGGPDWTPEVQSALRLQFDFSQSEGGRVTDLSGLSNAGTAHNVALADGRPGHKAFRFAGDAYIDVPKSKSLNPARSAWTVEVVAKPEKPDGVLVAHGGRSQGYALWLKAGRPVFTVIVANKSVDVAGSESLSDWATLTGTITLGHKAQLLINGKLIAEAPLPGFIGRDPNDGMQIGADLGSPVVEPNPPKFTGWLESVRIFSGEEKR
jgi:hypothetical protein